LSNQSRTILRLAAVLSLCTGPVWAGARFELEGAPPRPRIVIATFFSELLPGLRAITEDFEAATGIALDVQGVPYLSYRMWLHARFLGEDPPDVLLLESTELAWRYGQAGLMVCFDDLIDRPNPLAADTRPWSAAFRKPHIQQSLDTNGHLYLIPFTQYGVGFFYNKKQYTACALQPPTTWDGLLRNMDRLQEEGYTAFVTAVKPDDAQTVWIAATMLECFMRVHIPEVNLRTTPGWRFDCLDRECTIGERIDLSERIAAFEKGIIDPRRAPELAEVARLVKDMSRRWRPDFLSLGGEQIYKIFASGQTAHMMNGTWYLGELADLQALMREVAPETAFDYGVFPFPELTPATTSLARAGGINQNAGMRSCLMVPVQKKAPWRRQAAIALCHYLTLPGPAAKVFSHSNTYDIPAVAAVPPKPEAEALMPKREYAFLPLMNFAGYDTQSLSEFWPLWQGFLGGTMDLETFLAKLSDSHRASLVRQAEIYAEELDVEFLTAQLGPDNGWVTR